MRPSRLALLAVVVCVGAIACAPAGTPAPTPEATSVPVVEPISLGNGVFYFPATGEAYQNALVKFYEGNGKHCDLQGTTEKVVVISPSFNNATRHTETTGFILRCHDLAIEAQSLTVQ